MPITKSAKKALRQSARRKSVNDRKKRAMKNAMKEFEKLAKGGKFDAAKLSAAYQAIDKAMKGRVIKKQTAARKKSRLARLQKPRSEQ